MGKAMAAVICITHVLSITAAAIPSCCRPLITHFHNLAAICNYLQASTHFGDKSKIFGGGNCKRKFARSFSLRSVRPTADCGYQHVAQEMEVSAMGSWHSQRPFELFCQGAFFVSAVSSTFTDASDACKLYRIDASSNLTNR